MTTTVIIEHVDGAKLLHMTEWLLVNGLMVLEEDELFHQKGIWVRDRLGRLGGIVVDFDAPDKAFLFKLTFGGI